jgi:beta-lactamase regulating signal transducer with metallopeptidase domain
MGAFGHLADVLLTRLLWTSMQTIVLVAIIALAVRLLPRLPAAARSALWWLVGLQVVLGLVWQAPIRLPLLQPPEVAVTMQSPRTDVPTHAMKSVTSASASSKTARYERIPWREGLLVLWALGVLIQVPVLLFQRRRLRDILRRARAASGALQKQCSDLAQSFGLRRRPQLLMSRQVAAPLVAGWRRPVIVLPYDYTLTSNETPLAMAHELAHIKRGDLLLGIIPTLARHLFFFHPLVRWAEHAYAAYREAACDAVAVGVRGTNDTTATYGEFLLRLGVRDAHIGAIGTTSETFRDLKLRLTMLQRPTGAMLQRRTWALIVCVAILGAVPYRVVAITPSSPNQLQTRTAPSPAPAASSDSSTSSSGITVCCGHHEVDIGEQSEQHGLVLFDKGNVLISATNADVAAAKKYYDTNASIIWFRHGHRAYVIRDAATIERAKILFTPAVKALNDLNTILEQEGTLARRQGDISEREAAISTMQADLSAEQSRDTAAMNSSTDVSESRRQASKMVDQHERSRKLQSLEGKRASLESQRHDLSKQVTGLAKRVRLSKQRVEEMSRNTQDEIIRLTNKALKNGLAQPVTTR